MKTWIILLTVSFLAWCMPVALANDVVQTTVQDTIQKGGTDFRNLAYADALAAAKAEGKLLFVDCYTSWCGPCKQMTEKVFPQKAAGDYFNPRFVCVKYDMEKGEGVELAKQWGVRAFPTFLIIRSDGTIQHRLVGADDLEAFIARVEQEVGTIDILVNNAGIIKRIPMCEMSAAEFRQVIDVDLNAPFIVSKAVIPGMIRKGHGKIINICSMMSELGRETVSAYAAAKGGLKMLTRNIASEYGEYNIQCNGIGPGYIATPQTAPLRERQADGSRHPFDAFIVAKTPAARWGTPEDLMGPAVFLASEASDFVNGHVLYVDGGILAYIGKQPK